MVQLQLVPVRFGNGIAVLAPEGFREFQKFPYLADIQALPVQGAEVSENAENPGGKGGGGSEIENELGYCQPVCQSQPNKIPIGNAVPGHGQHSADQVHQQPLFFYSQKKGETCVMDAVKQIEHPVLQPKNADVLSERNRFGLVAKVSLLVIVSVAVIPVGVYPVVLVPGGGKFAKTGGGHQCQQPGIQAGKNGKVDQQPTHIGEQCGQGAENLFCSGHIALRGLQCLVPQPLKRRVHGVWIGGFVEFSAYEHNYGATDLHNAERGVFSAIGFSTLRQQQSRCEKKNGANQCGQGRVPLHQPQDLWSDVKSGQIVQNFSKGNQSVENQSPPPGVPADGKRPDCVLQRIIGLLLLVFFHRETPLL